MNDNSTELISNGNPLVSGNQKKVRMQKYPLRNLSISKILIQYLFNWFLNVVTTAYAVQCFANKLPC